jgi:hypothetical protein
MPKKINEVFEGLSYTWRSILLARKVLVRPLLQIALFVVPSNPLNGHWIPKKTLMQQQFSLDIQVIIS